MRNRWREWFLVPRHRVFPLRNDIYHIPWDLDISRFFRFDHSRNDPVNLLQSCIRVCKICAGNGDMPEDCELVIILPDFMMKERAFLSLLPSGSTSDNKEW